MILRVIVLKSFTNLNLLCFLMHSQITKIKFLQKEVIVLVLSHFSGNRISICTCTCTTYNFLECFRHLNKIDVCMQIKYFVPANTSSLSIINFNLPCLGQLLSPAVILQCHNVLLLLIQ